MGRIKIQKQLNTVFILLVVLTLNIFCFGQKNATELRNFSTKDFPKIEGDFWHRNPATINTDSISFSENNEILKVKFAGHKAGDSLAKNKRIVFLVLNNGNLAQVQFHSKLIQNYISANGIEKGDQFEIVSLGCGSKHTVLSKTTLTFTDNPSDFLKEVKKELADNLVPFCSNNSDLYSGIKDLLNKLKSEKSELPTGIFILDDNQSTLNGNANLEEVQNLSLELDIPLVFVNYADKKSNAQLSTLAEGTFGDYVSFGSSELSDAESKLKTLVNNFISKHGGVFYHFTYDCTFEKDGKEQEVSVKSSYGTFVYSFETPEGGLFAWINDNALISTLLLILLVGGVLFLIRRNKKPTAETPKNTQTQTSTQTETVQRHQATEKEIQKAWIEYRFDNQAGSFPIEEPYLIVGRDVSCNWVIPHKTISRQHFALHLKENSYYIQDLNSSNGIFLNGVPISEAKLNEGDAIRIGQVNLIFHYN